MHLDLLQDQVPKGREIAILKLDVEGKENTGPQGVHKRPAILSEYYICVLFRIF